MKAKELDLRNVLSFSPTGGIMQFMGHRALLIDAVAMGLLRKELIENLGMSAARNIMTRMGYAHGWQTADNLNSEYPDLLQDVHCGPKLHMLQGLVNVTEFAKLDDPCFTMTSTWTDSYEAEQHILHLGVADEPVCWTLTGWVSGYCSRMLGREVYCIEDRCCGKGDASCHIEIHLKEDWGETIEPHLPFFRAETIENVLKGVNTKLRHSERRLLKIKRLFDQDIHPSGIIANSKIMKQVLSFAKRVAKAESSVVVTGETGVGKEMIARVIHDESVRADRPFVAVNCSAVMETLLESEFFGHAKGSFTGADKDHPGLFEAASGGTLFLDEIGEISAGMQAKLLRTLQEKEVRRVGESRSRPVNVRIIAATNRDLDAEVKAGRFREDLYYRLRVIELQIPPLRERQEDIMHLAHFFLEKTSQAMGRNIIGFMPKVADQLLGYAWPGNVRQLQNTVEHAVALCNGKRIGVSDLPRELLSVQGKTNSPESIRPLDEVEREYILASMKMTDGDKVLASRRLGISLSTLYNKLKGYGAA